MGKLTIFIVPCDLQNAFRKIAGKDMTEHVIIGDMRFFVELSMYMPFNRVNQLIFRVFILCPLTFIHENYKDFVILQ